MNYFHQHFGLEIDTNSVKIKKKIKKLQKLYEKIPATICNFCPKKKTVEADCCKHFSPPMYFIEFLDILRIIEKWSEEKRNDLLSECYQSYANPDIVRPCALLNETLCSIYEGRPFSCRMYGQYPKEEWANRLKTVSSEWEVPIEEIPMNEQCGEPNVSFAKKKIKTLTVGEENKIFKEIANFDAQVVTDCLLSDVSVDKKREFANELVFSAATYMPFDAHYILLYSGPDQLDQLTEIRFLLQQKNKKFKAGEIDEAELRKVENQVEDFISAVKNNILTLNN